MRSLEGARILFLEDEVLLNLDTSDALEKMGCQVTSVFSIEEAWRSAKDGLPDAAVLDISLSGDGTSYEFAHWLNARGVPVVFLTGYEFLTVDGKWRNHPRCAKPCDPVELRKLLNRALGAKHVGTNVEERH